MSNIVLVGATGNIGSRVLDEALRRGHGVTALTRDPAKLSAREGMRVMFANTWDSAGLGAIIKGHDATIVSVKWNENDIGQVIEAVRKSGTKRVLFVVQFSRLARVASSQPMNWSREAVFQAEAPKRRHATSRPWRSRAK